MLKPTRLIVSSEMVTPARPRLQEMCVHTFQKHDRKLLRLKKSVDEDVRSKEGV
jgi:hypothetical protein